MCLLITYRSLVVIVSNIINIVLFFEKNTQFSLITDSLSVIGWNCLERYKSHAIFFKKAQFAIFLSVFWPAVSFLARINYPGIPEPVLS